MMDIRKKLQELQAYHQALSALVVAQGAEVLLVETHLMSRRALENACTTLGMRAPRSFHQNGKEALTALLEVPGSVILVYEVDHRFFPLAKVLAAIKEKGREHNVRVIATANPDQKPLLQAAIGQGLRHLLVKPLVPDVVEKKLREILLTFAVA